MRGFLPGAGFCRGQSFLYDGHRWTPLATYPVPTRAAPYGTLFGLAPSGVYLATNCCQTCGALLPHLFTLTGACALRRLFSVALSVGSRLPGITWHSALWSPDFPPPACPATSCGTKTGSDCPSEYLLKEEGCYSVPKEPPREGKVAPHPN
jgi:hypothetical protein